MTSTPVFPQAYTVETVAKAYEWANQHPELKASIPSVDQLVQTYLRAKRLEERSAAPQPGSFERELKSLAKSLSLNPNIAVPQRAGFDSVQGASQTGLAEAKEALKEAAQNLRSPRDLADEIADHVSKQIDEATQSKKIAPTSSVMPPPKNAGEPKNEAWPPNQWEFLGSLLDQDTCQEISNIQKLFNLSHPAEALRLMIRVGTKRWEGLKDHLLGK